MPKLTPRQANADDLPSILTLLADDKLGQGREETGSTPHPDYLAAFDAIRDDPNQFLAVFELDGRIAGCLQLSFIPGLSRRGTWRGQIESVRVNRSLRGTGLGREMINWAIETCQNRGCRLIQLTSDKSRTEALAFYRSLGFIASHDGFKLDLTL